MEPFDAARDADHSLKQERPLEVRKEIRFPVDHGALLRGTHSFI